MSPKNIYESCGIPFEIFSISISLNDFLFCSKSISLDSHINERLVRNPSVCLRRKACWTWWLGCNTSNRILRTFCWRPPWKCPVWPTLQFSFWSKRRRDGNFPAYRICATPIETLSWLLKIRTLNVSSTSSRRQLVIPPPELVLLPPALLPLIDPLKRRAR